MSGQDDNNGNHGSVAVEDDAAIAKRFTETIHGIPLGRAAEQQCPSLVEARVNGQPITRSIMIDYIEALGRAMRQSKYVSQDTEILMEIQAEMRGATPLIRRLVALAKEDPT